MIGSKFNHIKETSKDSSGNSRSSSWDELENDKPEITSLGQRAQTTAGITQEITNDDFSSENALGPKYIRSSSDIRLSSVNMKEQLELFQILQHQRVGEPQSQSGETKINRKELFRTLSSRFSLSGVDLDEQQQILKALENKEDNLPKHPPSSFLQQEPKEYQGPSPQSTVDDIYDGLDFPLNDGDVRSDEYCFEEGFENMSKQLRLSGVDILEQQQILHELKTEEEERSSLTSFVIKEDAPNLIHDIAIQQQLEILREIGKETQELEAQVTRSEACTTPRKTLEIYPGHHVPLYDEDVINNALLWNKDVTVVNCEHCLESGDGKKPGVVMSTRLHCVNYASMVFCPICSELSSVPRKPSVRSRFPLKESVCVGVLVK